MFLYRKTSFLRSVFQCDVFYDGDDVLRETDLYCDDIRFTVMVSNDVCTKVHCVVTADDGEKEKLVKKINR